MQDQLLNLLEDHIALHADNIQADRAVTRDLQTWEPMNVLRSLEDVLKGFCMLGFKFDSSLPWERLGLCWEEGPLPDESFIQSQVRLSTNLLRAVATSRNDPAIHARCTELEGIISESGR